MGNSYTAQDFITAIPGTGGIVSAIARKVGCEWVTAKKWIDSAPTVKRAYDAECEAMLDLAESTVLKNIKDGDTADAKWYLTKKGKRRGYGEAVEVSGPNGGPIKGEQVIEHRIDGDTAETIFGILAAIGAVESPPGNAADDEVYTADANN